MDIEKGYKELYNEAKETLNYTYSNALELLSKQETYIKELENRLEQQTKLLKFSNN